MKHNSAKAGKETVSPKAVFHVVHQASFGWLIAGPKKVVKVWRFSSKFY
jgi:hypothetical protein